MKIKLFFILMLVILVGCNKENDEVVIQIHKEQYVNYLENYGWSIDRFASETKYAAHTLQSFKSHVKDIKELGHVDDPIFGSRSYRDRVLPARENNDVQSDCRIYTGVRK